MMPVVAEDEGWESPGDSHVVPAMARGENGDADDIIDIDDDQVCQPVPSMPEPLMPSKAVVDSHNLTHWPYRSWCPHCVAARRPNSHHRRRASAARRTVPLLCADYCFVRDNEDEALATCLVCKFEPSNLMLSTVVDEKGNDESTINRLAQYIKESGYMHIVYRSDQEPSIRALFESAAKQLGRQIDQMVPEASSVGESQSNGRAEAAVKVFEDKLRTYKSALETRIKQRIPSSTPVLRWMAEHVCSIHNRIVCNSDGKTPFETIHGQRWRGRMVEFGEQVFYFVPKRLRAKLNLRWRLGTFLGNSQATNECYVAAANGDVVKTRSITRVVEGSRWSAQAVLKIRGTPSCFRPSSPTDSDAAIEELLDPHANADNDPDLMDAMDDEQEKARHQKQIRITQKDLATFGYTEGCRRCDEMRRGVSHKNSKCRDHTDECRLRLYLAYKEGNHEKYNRVRHLIENPEFDTGQVDKEGAAATPRASPDSMLYERGQPSAHPKESNGIGDDDELTPEEIEAMDLEDVLDTTRFHEEVDQDMAEHVRQDNADGTAEMFMDEGDEDGMATALRDAGADAVSSFYVAGAMCKVKEKTSTDPTVLEVYGTSIHSHLRRRNLNIQGLGALDIRTVKPNGKP